MRQMIEFIPFRRRRLRDFLLLAMVVALGCDGASTEGSDASMGDVTMSDAGNAEDIGDTSADPENPYLNVPNDDSNFTGKLIFSSAPQWPLNIYNFDTNTFEISNAVEAESEFDSFVQSDLDPTSTYAAYTRTLPDGLSSGKTHQIVVLEVSTGEETPLPFETPAADEFLNTDTPSIAANGSVVFEQYIDVVGEAGFPVDRVSEGIGFWDGSNAPVLLPTGDINPSQPRITQDGQTVFFIGDQDSKRAIFKIDVVSGLPELVGGPRDSENLAVNDRTTFDISSDGTSVIYRVNAGDVSTIRYAGSAGDGAITIDGPPVDMRITGDGSKAFILELPGANTPNTLTEVNLADGSERTFEDDLSRAVQGFSVSHTGDAIAVVSQDPSPISSEPNLFSLFVYEPGKYESRERVMPDSFYGGISGLGLRFRFRGGVK